MWQGQKFERPKNRPVLIEASHRIVHSGQHQLLAVMLPTVIETRIRGEKINQDSATTCLTPRRAHL